MRTALLAIAISLGAAPAIAAGPPPCKGGNLDARKVVCLSDGDSGHDKGLHWRLAGVDSPEKPPHAECAHEAAMAILARDRLSELMAGGYTIHDSGKRGRYRRAIVSIELADGRDAGAVLVEEGLAQTWPNTSNPWCR